MKAAIEIVYYNRGLLVIHDLDQGDMSVTNDAQAVFEYASGIVKLASFNISAADAPPRNVEALIYRDSMGAYDMIYIEHDVVNFLRLGYTDLDTVVSTLQTLTIN